MIELSDIRVVKIGHGMAVGTALDRWRQEQLARKLEKHMLSNYGIICKVRVK